MRSHVPSARSTTLSLRFSLVSTTTARSASSSWPSGHSLASPSIVLNVAVRPLSQREVWTTSKPHSQLDLLMANQTTGKVTYHIKYLYNGVTIGCAIDKGGPGKYTIQYTSTVHGRHELTVFINGYQVAGSRFPV